MQRSSFRALGASDNHDQDSATHCCRKSSWPRWRLSTAQPDLLTQAQRVGVSSTLKLLSFYLFFERVECALSKSRSSAVCSWRMYPTEISKWRKTGLQKGRYDDLTAAPRHALRDPLKVAVGPSSRKSHATAHLVYGARNCKRYRIRRCWVVQSVRIERLEHAAFARISLRPDEQNSDQL